MFGLQSESTTPMVGMPTLAASMIAYKNEKSIPQKMNGLNLPSSWGGRLCKNICVRANLDLFGQVIMDLDGQNIKQL